MEDPLDHRPLHQGDHLRAHDGLGVDAGLAHAGHVVELEARQALHHQQPPGDQLGMWARHDVPVLAEVVEHRRDVEHVRRLDAEVELLDDRVGEQLDQRRRVGEGGDGDPPDEVRRQPGHRPQVDVHETADVGPLDLDDDILAGAQPGPVDLGDRGRSDGRAVERREHVLQRPAELGLDRSADHIERLGGDLVAAALELLDELGGEQALAGGDDLAELDERRPEGLSGQPQPARQVGDAVRACELAPLALDQPWHDRSGQARRDDHTAPAGRQTARRDQVGDGLLGQPAQLLGVGPPGDGIAVEHPRGVVGERAPTQVG